MTLRLPQLGESLCGCSLKTASKIIGWICMILSVFLLWFIIVELSNGYMGDITRMFGIDFVEEEYCYRIGYSGDGCSWGTHRVANAKLVGFVSLVIATFLIVSAIFNSLLLVGIYNNRPNFIRAWIVALIFVIFMDLITVISTLIAQPYNPLLRLIIISINVYCLLIVNSYHCNLKQGRSMASPPSYGD